MNVYVCILFLWPAWRPLKGTGSVASVIVICSRTKSLPLRAYIRIGYRSRGDVRIRTILGNINVSEEQTPYRSVPTDLPGVGVEETFGSGANSEAPHGMRLKNDCTYELVKPYSLLAPHVEKAEVTHALLHQAHGVPEVVHAEPLEAGMGQEAGVVSGLEEGVDPDRGLRRGGQGALRMLELSPQTTDRTVVVSHVLATVLALEVLQT